MAQQSNKKVMGIIAAVVIVIALLIAGYFLFFSEDESQSSNQTSEQQQSSSSQSSINDLLAKSENVTCTFSYTDTESGTASSGTVYIASGERMSGDFVSTIPGQEQQMTGMIQTSETVYTWDKNTKNGVKYNKGVFDAPEQDGNQSQPNEDESVDRNQKYDFSCEEWKVDDSKFTPPSDVTFTSFDEELQQVQELSNQAQDIQQQACQQIADPQQRAACEQAIQ